MMEFFLSQCELFQNLHDDNHNFVFVTTFGDQHLHSQISAGDVFKTFFVLVSTGKFIAEAGSMTSDLAKGSAAISSVFKILDRPSPQVRY